MTTLRKQRASTILLLVVAGVLLTLRPGSVPRIWFDEGWVLSLARNWVDLGHYGHLRLGEPVTAQIPATGLPAVAPVALSFDLFGVGLWQARLPGILFTVAALAVLCWLARRLYAPSAAVSTLAAVLFLSPHPVLHPILAGRQALGDMPALFFLLSGFALFAAAWQRPGRMLPFSVLAWSLSLRTKTQFLPFLVIALAFPLAIALWKHRRRASWLLGSALAGTLAFSTLMAWGQRLLIASALFAPTSGHELYSWLTDVENLTTYVIVPNLSVRLGAVQTVLVYGIPLVAGLLYSGRKILKQWSTPEKEDGGAFVRLALWTFVASWLAWYVLLSIGFARWLFPAAFVGNLYVAAILRDVSGGFSLRELLRQGAQVLQHRRPTGRGIGVLLLAVVIPVVCVLTILMLYAAYSLFADDSVAKVADWLNTRTEPDAVVETYDSELFFLLDRPYHFPPDSVQDQLNRQTFLGDHHSVDYNPWSADPDYVVIGPQSRLWGLYDPLVDSGLFAPVLEVGGYEILERVG